MKVLLACEESQVVCKEFRKLGYEAYSCDILPCSGGHPEWHIQDDIAIPLKHERWDMIIAFPPCTDLAVSGAAWFEKKRENGSQRESIHFFMQFVNANCDKVAIENPVGIISGEYIKKHYPELCQEYGLPIMPTQIIQPWQFGDEAQKTTCLWLKGLPKLKPTKIVGKGEFITHKSGKRKPKWFADAFSLSPKQRSIVRSKTFPGIAKAMAEQWGGTTDAHKKYEKK